MQAAREAVSEGKRKSETKAEKMNTARAELNAVLDKIGFLAYDQDSNIPRRELRSKIGNLVTFWYSENRGKRLPAIDQGSAFMYLRNNFSANEFQAAGINMGNKEMLMIAKAYANYKKVMSSE